MSSWSEEVTLSTEDQNIITEELKILAQVLSGLVIQFIPGQRKDYMRDILELRDSIGETRLEDLPAIMAQMERLALLSVQQEKHGRETVFNRSSPYFAHIRLEEQGRQRDVLIGNQHCSVESLPIPVIDWKNAPISKIFYRYQEGEEYNEEIGQRNVEGTLLLRRTLTIQQGELRRIETPQKIYLLDKNGWQVTEAKQSQLRGGSGASIRPTGMSSFTQGKLGHASLADKHLHAITALIDKDQFDVIIKPQTGVLVIKGGAGSGKTTIALHRLAYLMSIQPHHFTPETVSAVVLNQALATFISKILPSLGIENVQANVYLDWSSQFRKRYFPGLPSAYSERTPASVVTLKRHPLIWSWLQEEVARKETEFEESLKTAIAENAQEQQVWQAWQALGSLPLAARILDFQLWCQGELIGNLPQLPLDYALTLRLQKLFEEHHADLVAKPFSIAKQIWDEIFLNEKVLSEHLTRLAPGEFTAGQIREIWRWSVLQYRIRLNAKEVREVREEDSDSEEVTSLPLPGDLEEEMSHLEDTPAELDEEDDTLLLLLYHLTIGPFRLKKRRSLSYSHLMVDEAQDFSPLELRLLLKNAHPSRPSVTLAGDFDQKIIVNNQLNDWPAMLQHLELENAAISSLNIGYRSTQEIMEVGKAILGSASVNPHWQATRSGAAVENFRFQTHGELVDFLGQSLQGLMARENQANVVLLTRYPAQAELIYKGLVQCDVPRLRRVRQQDFSFQAGVEITDIMQVKGLEFDYVILIDVDRATFPEDEKSRHLLYVGVTRAIHQLWVMSCDQPSVLLPLDLMVKSN